MLKLGRLKLGHLALEKELVHGCARGTVSIFFSCGKDYNLTNETSGETHSKLYL